MEGTGRRRVYLMRHGHVDYFAKDLKDARLAQLTDEGRAQAQAARDALRHVPFDIAVCSGLSRAKDTAEIVISANLGPAENVVDEPGFEELKSGWLTAETRFDLAARLAFCFEGAAEPEARFLPDGERFVDAEHRIVAALTRVVCQQNWRTALIVAHEGVNRILLGWASRGGLQSIAAFEQDLGCVNIIDLDVTPALDGGGLKIERALIKSLNVTPYDFVKSGLSRTSLEHLFDVDFGASRPANRSA